MDAWSQGEYDGVLGFSQGAVIAAVLCAELARRAASGDASVRLPRFAVIIAGFGRPVPEGLEAFPPASPLAVPSLHIWGDADDHIPGVAGRWNSRHWGGIPSALRRVMSPRV